MTGKAIAGRLGYRYVGDHLGIMFGICLGVKYFQNRARDVNTQEQSVFHIPITHADKIALQKRFNTSFRLGIEVGLAF